MSQSTGQFSDRDQAAMMTEYRRFNAAAWLALVFACVSAVALLTPFLWVVPALGIIFALTGLMLAARNDNMGGRVPAWIALTLSVFCLAWATSAFYFQRGVIYAETQEVGEKWLQLLVDGESEIAHQAMLHPARRQASNMSVDDYYARDEEARRAMASIFDMPPVSEVIALGKDAQVTLLENLSQAEMKELPDAMIVRQIYRIAANNKSVKVILNVTRQFKPDFDRASWIIAEVQADN